MSIFRALFAQRPAKAALAVWALLPTLFLFFALTLAVDPTTQLTHVRLGVAVLDKGVTTPQGTMIIGSRLLDGLHQQLPVEVVSFANEADLRAAVLAHEVAGGVVFPPGMTQQIQARQPVTLQVVKTDAADPFTNAFMTNLATQLGTHLNEALLALLGGTPTPALVSVEPTPVAVTSDFRFSTIPAALLLPIWIATVGFAVLLGRAAEQVRQTSGLGMLGTSAAELAVGAVGAALVAAVITFDFALFSWRWDLDFVGLFGLLWVGLLAAVWLIQGTMRLVGLELGAALGVLALFIQQPVSGAAFPPAFAPDAVRWAADVAPLRYLVEGLRNVLIGGSTTPDMMTALAALAGAGLLLFATGVAGRALRPSRRPQPAPSL